MTYHRRLRATLALLLALPLLLIPLRPTPVLAVNFCVVTHNGATGAIDLTYALADTACPVVTFAPGVTDVSDSSHFQIARSVTIQGPGRDVLTIRHTGGALANGGVFLVKSGTVEFKDLTIADGNASGDVGGGLAITSPANVTLTRVAVTGNTANSGGGLYVDGTVMTLIDSTIGTAASPNTANVNGGGLYVANGGRVTLTGSTIAGNKAYRGGGVSVNVGDVTLTNSTVSGNTAVFGGGLFTDDAGATLDVNFATVTGNTATYSANVPAGGGFYQYAGALTIRSSIIAGNRRGATMPDDCHRDAGTLDSQGRNLWGDRTACPRNAGGGDQDIFTLNVGLASVLNPALADNSGLTPTHALVAGSPVAIDQGDNVTCPATDQRSLPRPDGKCDIGAFEYQPPTPSPSPSPSSSPSHPPMPSPSASPSPSPAPCGQRFGDVPAADPACAAIEALAARGIINGCDGSVTPPLFCPADTTLREQMAALIVRAMPGWADETWPNTFTDQTDDTELMRRVGTLQHYGVAGGYNDCPAQGKTAPCYGPLDPVLKAQAISFVTRAMVAKGYWVKQAINPALYGGALNGTGHEQDAATYWYYTRSKGGVPDYPEAGTFPVDDAAPRAWFARLLWTAIQGTPAAP